MISKRFSKNVIQNSITLFEAMQVLNSLPTREYLTLFAVNTNKQLVGTLTDGDIRRGLLAGVQLSDKIESVMRKQYRFLNERFQLSDVDILRKDGIDLCPILNSNKEIVNIVQLTDKQCLLPLDAFLLAGGEGRRLRPLTSDLPKPMLKVGDKPILEINLERLKNYGIETVHLSVNYLKEKISGYFEEGENFGLRIHYVNEDKPLGTVGSLSLVKEFTHDTVLIMNSDLLTNIDFEDFYRTFLKSGAQMAVAGVPYRVEVPYAIMEVDGERVVSFKEKPTYTYYSNAGIYLVKKQLIDMLPKNEFFNATDLMDQVIANGQHLIYYPILGYWLDIGNHRDFEKAQDDIRHIKL